MKFNKPPQVIEKDYTYDYLVCFQPKKTGTSWIGKIFGHVILWRNVNAICSIRIEPTLQGMLIVPYNQNVNNFIDSLGKEYRTYIWRTNSKDLVQSNYIPEIFNCVSVAKRLLGIQKWYIITPRQLEEFIKSKIK